MAIDGLVGSDAFLGRGLAPRVLAMFVGRTLKADGDRTIVRLEHRGFPDENAVREHTEGWDHYLARLQVAAAGGDPGPDTWGHA